MKKSEQYYIAMMCVLNGELDGTVKLEVIETLMNDRRGELWSEEREEKAAKEAEA